LQLTNIRQKLSQTEIALHIAMKDDAKDSHVGERWRFAVIPIGVLLVHTAAWPLRDIALVYWVRGRAAYDAGIRVLQGKPTRFSDGQIAPDLPDFITGLLTFVVAIFSAVVISWFFFRVYEKIYSRRVD
jgi:hypothetical protein